MTERRLIAVSEEEAECMGWLSTDICTDPSSDPTRQRLLDRAAEIARSIADRYEEGEAKGEGA